MHSRHYVRRLDTMTDAQLHTLHARIQTLLLDRPRNDASVTVDLLSHDEAYLLALYRALPAGRRRHGLGLAEYMFTTLAACASPAGVRWRLYDGEMPME